MKSWNDVFDSVKKRHSLMSEFELAFHFGIPAPTISAIRSGTRRPSPAMVIRILDKAGYALTRDLFLSLLPPPASQSYLKWERKRMLASFKSRQDIDRLQAILDINGKIDWNIALDLLKDTKNLSTDKQLVPLIKSTTSGISAFRKGIRPMAMESKINLLICLGIPLDASTLEKVAPKEIEEAISQGILSLDFSF